MRPIAPAALPLLTALALVGMWPLVAHAQPAGSETVTVALAPLETLGAESKASRKTEELVAAGLGSVDGHEVVAARDVRRASKKDPRLAACSGQAECLSRLGEALGARYVVFGEVGGLGAAEVVYLELIDVAAKKSIRSTTLEFAEDGAEGEASDAAAAARAAAYQLLAPERYIGRMQTKVDVEGASIYVDGQRLARSPAPVLELAVGSHAVRITHPEFHDYVRFVDVEFDQTVEIEASLQEYPIVATDMERDPEKRKQPVARVIYRGQEPTPWYRQWYTVAGAGALVLVGSAVIVGLLANGIDADAEKVVLPPN